MKKTGLLFLCFALLSSGLAYAEQDLGDCTDHPLFTRMKKYYISSCEKTFDKALIMMSEEPDSPLNLRPEGNKTFIIYQYPDLTGSSASYLQIRRNYQNAGKKLNAKILVDRERYTAMQIDQNGSRIYVGLELFNDGHTINLTILEQKHKVNDVVANSKVLPKNVKPTVKADMASMNSAETIDDDQNMDAAATTVYNLNGKKITMTADDEITIKTGSAKIIMKKNGDITIEGKNINIKGSGNIVLKGNKIIEN
jgi:hypothetical protein